MYAVCPAQFVKVAKAVIDTVGHYSRPDLFSLTFHAQAHRRRGAGLETAVRAVESLPVGGLLRIADRHEVAPAHIEDAAIHA